MSQPARGYRVAIDPVLLAAAVPARAGERVLDAGAGTGAAALCLAVRVPGCQVVGIELQRALQRIAAANVVQNQLGERVEMLAGDLVQPPPHFARGSFDHVMTNPPHLAASAASAPPLAERAIAHVEGAVPLADWLRACLRMLQARRHADPDPSRRAARRHARRARRLPGRRSWCFRSGRAQGRPAKRVLVQGRKGSRAPLALMPGLILHEDDGRLSAAAEAVLRHGEALLLRDERAGRRIDG